MPQRVLVFIWQAADEKPSLCFTPTPPPFSLSALSPPPVLWYINNSLLTQLLHRPSLQHSDHGLLCTIHLTLLPQLLKLLLLLHLQHNSWVGGWSDAPQNTLLRNKLGTYRRCRSTVFNWISLSAGVIKCLQHMLFLPHTLNPQIFQQDISFWWVYSQQWICFLFFAIINIKEDNGTAVSSCYMLHIFFVNAKTKPKTKQWKCVTAEKKKSKTK